MADMTCCIFKSPRPKEKQIVFSNLPGGRNHFHGHITDKETNTQAKPTDHRAGIEVVWIISVRSQLVYVEKLSTAKLVERQDEVSKMLS